MKTEVAIGPYPHTKSVKGGIQRCEYNFAFIVFPASHPPYNSETLEDGSMFIVR